MALLRRLLGDALRRRRLEQARTLREVSGAARVSLGYLSEVERGQKEASSELLEAICTALDVPLAEVLREVSDALAVGDRRQLAGAVAAPAAAPPALEPVPDAVVVGAQPGSGVAPVALDRAA